MGRPFNFPKGPDLDNAIQPWFVDEGRPPEHQFRGYFLDNQRRPTFRYRYANVNVEDYFSQGDGAASEKKRIVRTVTLVSAQDHKNLRFRVAAGDGISNDGNRTFSIGKELQIRILSDHAAELIESNDGHQLRIAVDVSSGKKQELVFEYLWK